MHRARPPGPSSPDRGVPTQSQCLIDEIAPGDLHKRPNVETRTTGLASLPRRGHPYPTSPRALLLPAAAARPTARRRRPATCVPGSRPAPRFEPGGAASNGRLLTRPVARCAPSPAAPRRRPFVVGGHHTTQSPPPAHAAPVHAAPHTPPCHPPGRPTHTPGQFVRRCASPPPPSPPLRELKVRF